MGGNSEHWFLLSKYLVFLALAFSIVFSLPADANVHNTTTTVVHKVVKARDVTPEPVIPPAIMAKWAKVNICETGGDWHTRGPIYSGGLGILEVNWMSYGGWKFGAEYAATPTEQVFIAMKIQAAHGYAGYVPDQYGCFGGW
jgi:hypothetical protein